MVERPSPRLQGGGAGVLAAPSGPSSGRSAKDMTIEEMERALSARYSKRMPDQVRSQSGAQTARALLEENRQLIQEKQERKALARKNSRDFVEKLLQHDRLSSEGEKAMSLGRMRAQRELAQYYKAKIAEKEEAKANRYHEKVSNGVDSHYFPFVEGETINKHRKAKSEELREEMRGFLQKQREAKPPRADALLADTSADPSLMYPVQARPAPLGVQPASSSDAGPCVVPTDPSVHTARYPRFLSRAQEHMSRRLHDSHVRKALEEKVLQTKLELEALSQKRQAELRQWEEGLLVNDALKYDSQRQKVQERRRHAEFLRRQMEQQERQKQQDRQQRHQEVAGYWGPDEKRVQDEELQRSHCQDLIRQMEVDQRRRLTSRERRLQQERQLVDSCMAEMSQDREKDRQKQALHREVLTVTWQSQQKIREALKSMDAM